MAPLPAETLAIKRVRGKRRGTPAEKGKLSRRRRTELQQRHLPGDEHSPRSAALNGDRTIRWQTRPKGVDEHLSPLEKLPAEILQRIFELSANIELPVTASQLGYKLSKSQHLQHQLTNALLTPVLGEAASRAQTDDIARAKRLLDSRFMTWDFFQNWVRDFVVAAKKLDGSLETRHLWTALQPHVGLLPPRKLLVGPFSHGKVLFLSTLAQKIHDVAAADPVSGEWAHEGLMHAIQYDHVDAARVLLGMGVKRDTEMLRMAVIDNGCNPEMVQLLLMAHVPNGDIPFATAQSEVDLLDPALWNWVDQNRHRGNQKGEWLVQHLHGGGTQQPPAK